MLQVVAKNPSSLFRDDFTERECGIFSLSGSFHEQNMGKIETAKGLRSGLCHQSFVLRLRRNAERQQQKQQPPGSEAKSEGLGAVNKSEAVSSNPKCLLLSTTAPPPRRRPLVRSGSETQEARRAAADSSWQGQSVWDASASRGSWVATCPVAKSQWDGSTALGQQRKQTLESLAQRRSSLELSATFQSPRSSGDEEAVGPRSEVSTDCTDEESFSPRSSSSWLNSAETLGFQRFYRLHDASLLYELVAFPIFLDIELPANEQEYGTVRRCVQFAEDSYDYFVPGELLRSARACPSNAETDQAQPPDAIIVYDFSVLPKQWSHSHMEDNARRFMYDENSITDDSSHGYVQHGCRSFSANVLAKHRGSNTDKGHAGLCETLAQPPDCSNTEHSQDLDSATRVALSSDALCTHRMSDEYINLSELGRTSAKSADASIFVEALETSMRAWAAYGSDCQGFHEQSPYSSPAWSSDIDS